MNRIELLSPAGSLKAGIAAINAGADAVYIGAARFGAREKAANSAEDIAELCRYARRYGARVYVTVNTLIMENELESCRRLICEMAEAGADGIIIQDTGILKMDLPSVKLIASTQMNCGSAEKINFFYKQGLRRFILPRELSLTEIKEIRANIPEDAELEAFAHGALCVARSGECYLSWYIGRRSGNRGCCAQPCRNRYTLKDKDNNILAKGHLLSLKDLDLHNKLEDMIDAGICSFKIEGRLKNEDYVTNVTAFYRRELDRILTEKGLERASQGFSEADREFVPDITKTFNRGYSEFMINGRRAGVSSMDTPSMKGEELGIVKKVRGKRVFLDRKVSVNNGDGMAFIGGGILRGTNINLQESPDSVTVNESKGIKTGMTVYRNYDAAWNRTIPVFSRYIPVTVAAEYKDGSMVFWAEDRDGNRYTYNCRESFEPAKDTEKALANLRKQLGKRSEDSYLSADKVIINITAVPFIPISRINQIRRELHRGLMSYRAGKAREYIPPRREAAEYITDKPDYRCNISNSFAAEFYTESGVKEYEKAPETGTSVKGRQVMECRYCLRRELGLCSKDKEQNTPLILENEDVKLEAVFDCSVCTMRIIAK